MVIITNSRNGAMTYIFCVKFWSIPSRSFETIMKTVFVFAALTALLFPESVMRGPKDTGTIMHIRVIFFFWMVFATSAMTALYGFSRMKNFSSNLWKSRFLD